MNPFDFFDVNENGDIWRIDGKSFSISVCPFGYKSVRCSKNGVRHRFQIHRIVAMKYLKNYENKPEVNHKDFNPSNNKLENLEWATEKENVSHSMRHGRRSKKLTPEKVCAVRSMLKEGVPQYSIAKKIGINQSCVSDIFNGIAWSWLK